jgi:hypothetical protein
MKSSDESFDSDMTEILTISEVKVKKLVAKLVVQRDETLFMDFLTFSLEKKNN